MSINVNLLIYPSPILFSPRVIFKFVFYVCESISVS